jgi:hypothetical protein
MIGEALDHAFGVFTKIFATVAIIAAVAILYIILTWNSGKEIKEKAIEYLGGKCTDCGLVDEPCVYDFHHLDPTQKEIAFGSRGGKSFESLKPELDKCVLLCANCHRKRHYKTIEVN